MAAVLCWKRKLELRGKGLWLIWWEMSYPSFHSQGKKKRKKGSICYQVFYWLYNPYESAPYCLPTGFLRFRETCDFVSRRVDFLSLLWKLARLIRSIFDTTREPSFFVSAWERQGISFEWISSITSSRTELLKGYRHRCHGELSVVFLLIAVFGKILLHLFILFLRAY